MNYTALVYASTVATLFVLSGIVWQLNKARPRALFAWLCIIFIPVFAITFIGVRFENLLLVAIFIAISEEAIRFLLIRTEKFDLGILRKSILLSIPFALLETNNWIFIDKAAVALSEFELSPITYYFFDVAYILAEFLFGIIGHTIFGIVWIVVLGRKPDLTRILLAFGLTVTLHALFDAATLATRQA